MIRIQNQSVESFHRAVGLQPPPPFPTYSHPYHSTPTSPPRAQPTATPTAPTQAPSVTAPFTRTEPDIVPPVIPSSLTTRLISTEALLTSLSSALDPSVPVPSFSAVLDLVSDLATSSGLQPADEDVPTGGVTQVDSNTTSEEDTMETGDAVSAPVVVTTIEPTASVEPFTVSVEPTTLVDTAPATAQLAPRSPEPAPTSEPVSSPPTTETATESAQG